MGFGQRIALEWRELARTGNFLGDLPMFLRNGRWSAGRLLERTAKEHPEHTGIAYLSERYPWRRINVLANQYAHFFSKNGVRDGDVVALLMDNRPEFLFVQMGLAKIRAVSALINTNLTGHALTHAINVGKPRMVVVGSEHLGAVRDVLGALAVAEPRQNVCVQLETEAEVGDDVRVINEEVSLCAKTDPTDIEPRTSDPVSYIYTSGTTGLPKAAVVTNQRFLMAASAFGRIVHEADAGDVIYVTMPLYHSSAQWVGWGACLRTGATLALRRKFSASSFWKDVNDFGATHFVYIGELCRYLLNQPPQEGERRHQLRVGVGNGLRPDIWREFQERFGVPLIREFYGATEGNAPMINMDGVPGMVGRLRPGQVIVRCDPTTGDVIRNAKDRCEKVSVGETGLLLGKITAVSKFDGYVDDDATQKKVIRDVFKKGDRYFNSGDTLTLHEHGWASFADRTGDTFRWKGENVSTNEVAETLNRAGGVLEANVYGVVVPGHEGRVGMASVNTDDSFDVGAFASFVIENLPGYMRPHFVRVQREMRTTGTFKHQKVDYRNEGYDPDQVEDALYFLDGTKYVPIDRALYARIQSGEIGPR